MANISASTANWRLLGGGGLVLGGVLWTLFIALTQVGLTGVPSWLTGIALLIIAVAFVFVAFGETGSNGAVGKNRLGKVALVVFAVAWFLLAVHTVIALGAILLGIVGVLLIVGGLVSAYVIYTKGVAKGAARRALFVPAVVAVVFALGLLGVAAIAEQWLVALVLAILLAITGVLYLLNDRKIG